MRKNIFTLLLCLIVSCFGFAQNNVIEPELQTILNQKSDSYIDINIVLKSQMSSEYLSSLNYKGDSKEVRREIVVNELKKFSEESQKDVLEFLQAEAKNNNVIDINAHWLVNSINCKATRDVIYQLASHPDIEIIGCDEEIVAQEEQFEAASATRGENPTLAQHITHIKAEEAWKLGYTGKGIIVAIIDSGVNYNHVDLKDHLWYDGNNSYPGYNFLSPGTAPTDNKGHGTHCTGVVGGDGTSGKVTGVAPDATLMCLKVNDNSTSLSTLVEAVEYAVDKGADVISISKNGWTDNSSRETFRNLFNNTLSANIITVVSAGNYRANLSSNMPVPGNVMAPADCPPPYLHPDQTLIGGTSGVMCIGSVGYDNVVASFSSQGPVTWEGTSYNDYPYNSGAKMGLIRPDLVAPGEDIISLNNTSNNGFVTTDGTSISTPIVAGAIALMLEKNPDLTPAEICRILENTATKLTTKKSNDYGSGCIDVLKAVQYTEFNTNNANVNLYSFDKTIKAKQNTTFSLTVINNGKGTGSGNVTISTTNGNISFNSVTASYSGLAAGQTKTLNFTANIPVNVSDQETAKLTISIDGKSTEVEVIISNELVPPTNINTTATGTSITLSWAEANNATSYNIYRGGSCLTNTTSTTYTDENLNYGTLYTYNITTKRNSLESEKSVDINVQTSDNPEAPSPTGITANNGVVSWTNSTGSKSSNVYRKDNISGTETKLASNVNGTSYTDNAWNTLDNSVYQYGVSNIHAQKADLYETNFTTYSYPPDNGDVNLTNSTSSYPLMKAYWYQYNTNNGGQVYTWSFTSSIANGPVGSEKTFDAFDGNSAFIKSNYETNTNNLTYLVSPTMKFTEHNGKTVKLSFRYITPAWGTSINTLKVMVSNNYNSGWTELWSSGKANVTEWPEATVDLSAYVGQDFYIAFVNVAGYGYCTGVDAVKVYVEGDKESRIEWTENIYKNVNIFAHDGDWSNTDNWGAKRLPNGSEQVIIDANATIKSGDITLSSLTINEGKSLTLNSGVKLTVTGDFTNADADAFIINDGAQVIQNNTDVAATFNMNIVNPTEWSATNISGWQFIASPMKDANVSDFVPEYSDYDLYRYDGTKELQWINHKDENDYEPEAPETESTIGQNNGTETFFPARTDYNNTISQQIFLADDFQGNNGDITSYAFMCADNKDVTRRFKIYMINTDKTSFSSTIDWVNMTEENLVFDGSVTFSPKDEWTVVRFDTPFEYEEGKNVLLCVNDISSAISGTAMKYYYTTASNRTLVVYTDGTQYDATNITATARKENSVTYAKFTFKEGKPSAPKNLVASAINESTINLTWDAVNNATSYRVYNNGQLVATNLTETNFTINGLTAETEYCYTVAAVNAIGESKKSEEACAKTLKNYEVGTGEELEANSFLPAYDYGRYSFTQQIYLEDDFNGDAGKIHSISFKLANNRNESTRQYEVYLKQTNLSAFSNKTFVGVTAADKVFDGDVVISGVQNSWYTVSFDTPFNYTGGNLIVCVYDKTGTGLGSSLSHQFYTYSATDRSLTVFGADAGYNINSLPEAGNKRSYVNLIQFGMEVVEPEIPEAPQNLTASAAGSSAITLTWDAVDGAKSYNIYSGGNSVATGVKGTSYTVEGLAAATQYCYTVKAVNKAGMSEASNEACAETTPDLIKVEIGADQNPSSNYYLPIYEGYSYFISQQLYTAEEIGYVGKIYSISFKVARDATSSRTFEVYAKNTEDTFLTGQNISMTEADKVFDGNVEIGGYNTWLKIEFDTPFDYTGDNLLICVNDKTGTTSSGYHTFYTYSAQNRAQSVGSYSKYDASSSFWHNNRTYVNQIELEMKAEPTVVVNTESIAFGNVRLGDYWTEGEVLSSIDVTAKPMATNVTNISSTNPFFTLSEIDYSANPITFIVSYDKDANVSGEVSGNLVITHSNGTKEIPMTATVHIPVTPDVFELAQEITFTGDTYTNTPNFATLHDDYVLPKEVNDGSTPDAVYTINLAEPTALTVNVTGTNAKAAIYREDFEGNGGPSSNNYYEGFSDAPVAAPTTFFYDFTGASISGEYIDANGDGENDFRLIDQDGDGRNWEIYSYYGGTYLISYSWENYKQIDAKNYLMTAQPYYITENSVFSFNVFSTYSSALDSYKVEISKDGTNFITVRELTAASADMNNTDQVDLSEYAGENYYIAIKHESYDCMSIAVDNLQLTGDAGSNGGSDAQIDAVTFPAGRYYLVAAAEGAFTVTVTKSEAMEIPEIPAAPTVTATANDSKSITLSWNAVDGATTYKVYEDEVVLAETEETTYTIEGLTAETNYCYSVSAVNKVGESEATQACATTLAPPAAATTFFYDFNDGDLSDFIIVDNNNNGHTWSTVDVTTSGNFKGKAIADYSYTPSDGGFNADDFIYTANKYSITAQSKVSFDVQCNYPGEHYAVVVFTDNGNYEIVEGSEETLTASGTIYHKEYTLSKYVGQVVQIGFYHFNSYDKYAMFIDNFQLTDGSAKSRGGESNIFARLFSKKDKANNEVMSETSSTEFGANANADINTNAVASDNVMATGASEGIEYVETEEQTELPEVFYAPRAFDWQTFHQGVGYMASYQTETMATFKGTLSHEKSFQYEMSYNDQNDWANFHLFGNPFSFNMDWTKVTANNLATGYAVVNADGGYDYAANGEIKVGDGFFVKAVSNNPSLSYNQRGGNKAVKENANFINIIASDKNGKDNVVINMTDVEQENFPKIVNFNKSISNIYVPSNDKQYAIYNCNNDVEEVEVYFEAKKMGNYTINAEVEGDFEHVVLLDRFSGKETDLLLNDYNFTATTMDDINRFVVKFTFSSASDDAENNFAYQSGEDLIITEEGSVQILDIMGRVIYSNDVVKDNNRINVSELSKTAYIIRLITDDNVKTQKIVIY